MSPLEFMQWLAALVPRPRLHLIRVHGVLASNAKPRALVEQQAHEQRREGHRYHRERRRCLLGSLGSSWALGGSLSANRHAASSAVILARRHGAVKLF